MKIPFIFYCHANEKTGLGHLSRCLQIALAIKKQLPAADITFWGEFGSFASQLLTKSEFSIKSALSNNELKNACLILDSYDLTQADIEHFVSSTKYLVKIDDFDDLDTSAIDLIVNFRLGFDNHLYQSKHQALGIKYFPFKAALTTIRDRNLKIRNQRITHIFIFIGGNDISNAGEKLVQLIDKHLTNKKLYWVRAGNLETTLTCKNNELTMLPLTAEIEQYYQQADFFISGGGLSKYEVSFCGIPNASISQNSGQAQDSKIFDNYGLSYDLGITNELDEQPENIINKLVKYCDTPNHEKFYQQSALHFNSNSCNALAEKIIQVVL